MNSNYHRFSELFLQLGLPSDINEIQRFLDNHSQRPQALSQRF
ncbi:hypothetical protein B9Z44_02475 [Limnohabitans curvus]|uniref:DUF2789 domain-containing protein n=1 Tax=Limnohabitans curvus TaxID=323423 RepID=A0A315EKY0_9BURK|nr:DUF2789 family protein [Limnohabitans curvus]PUE58560.1 hypothetical protein B9Z44_02475 [Limnohabitans curvus]